MLIAIEDVVRPNKINLGMPPRSLWCVTGTFGGLKLRPANAQAHTVKHFVAGVLFNPEDFTRQTLNAVGEWVDEDDDGGWRADGDINVAEQPDEPTDPPSESKWVTKAREALAEATKDAAFRFSELTKAQSVETRRKIELRAAQLKAQRKEEQRKADAQARAGAVRRALQARLHADRCLGEATLELIAAVSGLLNGQPEAPVHPSIAAHVEQLQPLAYVYGYRIVKPNTVALLVKL